MKVVIMAGGRGKRISSIASDIPKPMVRIGGKPILELIINGLSRQGFKDIVITVSYLGDVIKEYFGDGRKYGINIQYYTENKPLGNAGALFKIRDQLTEDFLLLNADALFDIDFNRLVKFHKEKKGLATIFTHPNSHPYDSGLIISDNSGAVMDWLTKEDVRPTWYKNRVNAGIHVLSPEILDKATINKETIGLEINGKIQKVDLDRDILKPLCGTKKMYCYDSPEYVKDMGTPERYVQVCKDYDSGLVFLKNLSNKQKAIFLDRDGTINEHIGFLNDINDFTLLPGVSTAIKKINTSGYLAIVVTNQPVIARGELTIESLNMIHNKMETLLGEEGAYLDAIYYCPHHPDKGFTGEVTSLKIDCDCRKPKPGMILKAASDYNIKLSESWMIGDGKNDVLAGKAAGCNTILLGSSCFGQSYTANTLIEAVDRVLSMK
ncbi:MAG: HAD-IIIA family hydrolase [Lachnospiraceae bacterium]|nr:HAD-IIIA family hydrolase [Lachnospiraceae bacterium]